MIRMSGGEMTEQKKSNNGIIGVAILLAVIGWVSFFVTGWLYLSMASQTVSTVKETSTPIISSNISANVSSIFSTALVRKIIKNKGKNKATLEEIRQYDFNFPGTRGYKNSEEWSIFENSPDYNIKSIEGHLRQVVLSSITDYGDYIITLSNRIDGVGDEKPELLFILPNFKRRACEAINIKSNKINKHNFDEIEIPILEHPPNLSPHWQIVSEKEIDTLPRNLSPSIGCFEADGVYYYYQVIYEL